MIKIIEQNKNLPCKKYHFTKLKLNNIKKMCESPT